jgi:hypothetical protein
VLNSLDLDLQDLFLLYHNLFSFILHFILLLNKLFVCFSLFLFKFLLNLCNNLFDFLGGFLDLIIVRLLMINRSGGFSHDFLMLFLLSSKEFSFTTSFSFLDLSLFSFFDLDFFFLLGNLFFDDQMFKFSSFEFKFFLLHLLVRKSLFQEFNGLLEFRSLTL